jgi:uncharacterized protein YcbK (DUF882 family)
MRSFSISIFLLLLNLSASRTCLGQSTVDQKSSAPPPGSRLQAPDASAEPAGHRPTGDAATKRRKRFRCRSHASPDYRNALRSWQKASALPETKYRDGYRDLTLYAVNLGESVRIFPYRRDGSLDPEAIARIEPLFRDKHNGARHAVHPRLIKLLYKIADRFKARQINLISGYRESVDGPEEGNHGRGRAADIMIPGLKLSQVAYYARTLGHVGVGLYPVSGFIHLDVREAPSYFWVDRSGPGQPSCLVGILPGVARQNDSRYRPGQDEPRPHRNPRGELLGATAQPEEPSAVGN